MTRTDASGQHQAEQRASDRGWTARLVDWALSVSAVGLLASVAIHLLLAAVASGIVVMAAGPGAGRQSGPMAADVEVSILSETELESLEDRALGASSLEEALADALPSAPAPADDLLSGPTPDAGLPAGASSETAGLGGSGLTGGDGEGMGFGGSDSIGGAGDGSAKFFGVEARGSRFAYVVDISASMSGDKLDALKRELLSSIDALVSNASYSVVLYNSAAQPLGARRRWFDASERNKRQAEQMISRIAASGATHPAPAFEAVFSLRPKPDAIYFMTDGIFDPRVADDVASVNRSGPTLTPIHCISFGTRDAETILQKIAEESGGSYTYVPGPGR